MKINAEYLKHGHENKEAGFVACALMMLLQVFTGFVHPKRPPLLLATGKEDVIKSNSKGDSDHKSFYEDDSASGDVEEFNFNLGTTINVPPEAAGGVPSQQQAPSSSAASITSTKSNIQFAWEVVLVVGHKVLGLTMLGGLVLYALISGINLYECRVDLV